MTAMRWLLLPPFLILLWSLFGALPGFYIQSVERKNQVPWTPERLSVLAREAVSRTLFAGLWMLRWLFRTPPPGPRRGPSVLLVASPQWGWTSLLPLRWYLSAQGFSVLVVRVPAQPSASMADRAEGLAEEIGALIRRHRLEDLSLVAHSYGGLDAAWYLHHLDGQRLFQRLVTLGTPWNGTKMSVFWPGSAKQEVAPDALALDPFPPQPISITSLWCPDDPAVIPASSACLDASPRHLLSGTGHLGLLLSARAFQAVKRSLLEDSEEAK